MPTFGHNTNCNEQLCVYVRMLSTLWNYSSLQFLWLIIYFEKKKKFVEEIQTILQSLRRTSNLSSFLFLLFYLQQLFVVVFHFSLLLFLFEFVVVCLFFFSCLFHVTKFWQLVLWHACCVVTILQHFSCHDVHTWHKALTGIYI